jgi:hypothetical protein
VSHLENRLANIPDDHAARLRLVRIYMKDSDYAHALNHLALLEEKKAPIPELPKLVEEAQAKIRTGQSKKITQKSGNILTR